MFEAMSLCTATTYALLRFPRTGNGNVKVFCRWFKWTEIPAGLHFRLLWSSENRKRQTEGRPSRVGPQTNRPAGNGQVQA